MYLSAEAILCQYGARPVIDGLSLAVARGDFLAVIGPNGSGKSTLVKALTGSLPPRKGAVRLEGKLIQEIPARALARKVAVVRQETGVDFDFTVEEVVQMGRLPHLQRFRGETEADVRAVREALVATNTYAMKDRLVTDLSGGERQRVMIARALAQEPELLILDEPTAHLDIGHQVELLDLTRRLNREQGLTVIAVLHDLNLAAQYAGRVLLLQGGKRYAEGVPADVITELNIARVYGCPVRVTRHPADGTPHVFLLTAGERSLMNEKTEPFAPARP